MLDLFEIKESYKILDMIENYGSTTLNRTKIQHNYFRKKTIIKSYNRSIKNCH